ncbi:MAG TPA: TolC family protein [Candidatus Limnocylindria bacterium]|nr:TolC family protein [Candidatus Limnocylindria bacterium]
MNAFFPPALLGWFAATALTVGAAEPSSIPAAPLAHHAAFGTNRVAITPELLAALAAELRTNHPTLRAAQARANAAGLDAAGVRRFEDPTFKLGGSVASPRGFKTEEEGDLVYGVEQKLPLLGKEKAARGRAEAEAATEAERSEVRFEELRRELARAVFASALAEATVQLGTEDLAWLDTTQAATEARYQAGTSSQFELLRVQNERAKRATQIANDELRRDAARALVNHSLGREPRAPLPAFSLPALADEVAFLPVLTALAERHGPDLRVLRRERAAAATTVEVTRRSQRPDVALGVEGRQFSGDGGLREGLFTVSFSLPWFNRANYHRDLARDRERLHAVEEDQADAAISLHNEIHHLTVEAETARREGLLYRDEVLSRSERALAAAHAAWSGGRGMMNDVLEARRMLVESRLMLARATAEQWGSLSDLAYLCGLPDATTLKATTRNPLPEAKPSVQ